MMTLVRRRTRAGAGLTLLALLLVACGGTPPSAPPLVDPREILAAAATQLGAAKSVHLDVNADGAISLDLLGTGTNGTPIKLSDTTASADADLVAGGLHATFSAPGLLGVRGEMVIAAGVAFVKTSLTGPLFRRQSVADGGAGNPASSGPSAAAATPGASGSAVAGILGGLVTLLEDPTVKPVKNADVACGSATCYSVGLPVTAAQLGSLLAGTGLAASLPIALPDLSTATADVIVLVERDSHRLADLSVAANLGATGEIDADVRFSKWDEPTTISAPPADQVQSAP